MQIIAIYEHKIHGRVYLWSKGQMEYSVGKVNTNLMNFSGYLLEDVESYLLSKDFVKQE